jgi:uncharacterized protein (DUF58 family)
MPTPKTPGPLRRALRRALLGLKPNHRLRPTREGRGYFVLWLALLAIGLYLQSNLVLLIAGMAAGPLVASVIISATTLRRLAVIRRPPLYAFAGDTLGVEYTLDNERRRTSALATVVEDSLGPVERGAATGRLAPHVALARVPGRSRGRVRWETAAPPRGRYRFGDLELITSAPFGLLERRLVLPAPAELVVYPRVGHLARRWHQIYRQSTEARRGRRHDRSAQQQEYHGLRDYRPGDSLRWIHWRTSARLGQPMVKEFEQQSEQDLALLVDPWIPRSKATAAQREAVEEVIRFAASLCLDTCRQTDRRLVLGWTGAAPGLRQGLSSVKLLHELLEQLAVLRPSAEGQLAALLDLLPPPLIRNGLFVIVTTRPVNLVEEAERSQRLSGAAARSLYGRVLLLDAAKGDLNGLIQYAGGGNGSTATADAPAPPAPATVPVPPGGSSLGMAAPLRPTEARP